MSEQIAVRLTDELSDKLERVLKAYEEKGLVAPSKSDVVRKALERFLEDQLKTLEG